MDKHRVHLLPLIKSVATHENIWLLLLKGQDMTLSRSRWWVQLPHMSNATADKYQAAGYYVCADDTAGDAGQQASQQSVLEEGVVY